MSAPSPVRLTSLEQTVLVRITEAAARDPSIPVNTFHWTPDEKRALWRAFKKLGLAARA